MALEDKLDALTAALNRNSDLLEVLTSAAKAGAANKAAVKETPVATKTTGDDEDKGEAPNKRGRPAKAAAEDKPKPKKIPTPAEMADATKAFTDVDSDEEFDKRRALIKRILAKAGQKKMSELPENMRQAALDAIEAYKAGEPTGFDEEDEEDYA